MEFGTILTTEEIAKVKLNLMSNDAVLQITAVSWMEKNLNNKSDEDRERLVDTLITTDVATYLCEKIRCSHGQLFVSMLHIVEKLRQNGNFYKRNLAKRAVDSIVSVASIMVKKREAHEQTLALVAYTIYAIMDGAAKAEFPLDRVCDANRMILMVDNLNPRCSSKYILRLSVVRILCILMKNIDLESKETVSSLFLPFKNSLRSVGAIVIEQNGPNSLELAQSSIAIVCSACAIATRFCKGFRGDDFAEEITKVMIDAVIPRFKGMEFKIDDLQINVKNFVECLDRIFQLKNCNGELANIIATNGYLKFLLLIPSPSLRRSMGSLLSQIIAKLSEDDFHEGDSVGDSVKFRNFMNRGILALPSTVDRFADVFLILETEGVASDAFLVLAYHHAYKTHEYNLVPLSLMILKVVTLSDVILIPVLKAAWFLFAVSSLERLATDSVCYYSIAVRHLADLLRRHDLNTCYTHSSAILEHSLNCESFPIDLQYDIVRLWLDFDGNIDALMALKNSQFVDECLLSIVETGTEKLVNRASKAIAGLKFNEERWIEIMKKLWKRLPTCLGRCSGETATNVKELLKLARDTKPEDNFSQINRQSVDDWTKIFKNDEFDDELKILLLQYVEILIEVSSERNSTEVVKHCVRDALLVTALRDKGLSRENFELSGHSINLLAHIVECQRKFDIQCDDIKVTRIEPLRMLVLISRSNYKLFLGAVRLLINLLSQEKNDVSSFALCDFENFEAAEKALFAWYMKLHQLISKTQSKDWPLVYSCLIAVLKFCEKNCFSRLLKKLCDYAGTYELLRWTIYHRYANKIFFEFAEVWLQFGVKYRSASMIQANYAQRFEISSICDNEFDEIIQMLTDHRRKYVS